MRILVTGSRTWSDEQTIRDELESLQSRLAYGQKPSAITIVHGACPKGADAIADRVARELGYTVERHPVTREDLARHGSPVAYYARNQHMVDLGPYELCLALWDPGARSMTAPINAMDRAPGRGTGDTFTRAAIASIPVRIVPEKRR